MRHEKVSTDFPLPLKPSCLILVPALCDPSSAPTYNYLFRVLKRASGLTFQLEEDFLTAFSLRFTNIIVR